MILFVCLHGSAKSLIAATQFNRLAEARGMAVRAESAGLEPDAETPQAVVDGLANDGIDVRDYQPTLATPDRALAASHVVSLGCELGPIAAGQTSIEVWEDIPMVSDGYAAAQGVILARVETLLATIQSRRA